MLRLPGLDVEPFCETQLLEAKIEGRGNPLLDFVDLALHASPKPSTTFVPSFAVFVDRVFCLQPTTWDAAVTVRLQSLASSASCLCGLPRCPLVPDSAMPRAVHPRKTPELPLLVPSPQQGLSSKMESSSHVADSPLATMQDLHAALPSADDTKDRTESPESDGPTSSSPIGGAPPSRQSSSSSANSGGQSSGQKFSGLHSIPPRTTPYVAHYQQQPSAASNPLSMPVSSPPPSFEPGSVAALPPPQPSSATRYPQPPGGLVVAPPPSGRPVAPILHPEDEGKEMMMMRCRHCGQYGHIQRYCPSVDCYHCGSNGHMASG